MTNMNILFIHQNFPAQFSRLAPVLVQKGHRVVAMTLQQISSREWCGVTLVPYAVKRGSTPGVHPWLSDFETKTVRAEACWRKALKMKDNGFVPDVIIAHPGWGESMFLKDVWPHARLGLYCEYYYRPYGADMGFDPEFPGTDEAVAIRMRMKNLHQSLHFDMVDAGLSPTYWQADSYPSPLRQKITVIHDGIDTSRLRPDDQVMFTLPDGKSCHRKDELVTFVNRNLEPYRGYHSFMRALPEILATRPHARILIVGGSGVSYGQKPPPGKTWKEVFKEEISGRMSHDCWDRVHFLGNLAYDDYVRVLQASTVHVYLTYPFVLSWSLLEAMSIQCAVVGSDTAPVREVIQDGCNGLLANFFDPSKIAEAVSGLLDDPEARHVIGVRAREYVRNHFDLDSICLPRQLEWLETVGCNN